MRANLGGFLFIIIISLSDLYIYNLYVKKLQSFFFHLKITKLVATQIRPTTKFIPVIVTNFNVGLIPRVEYSSCVRTSTYMIFTKIRRFADTQNFNISSSLWYIYLLISSKCVISCHTIFSNIPSKTYNKKKYVLALSQLSKYLKVYECMLLRQNLLT